jgi:hypothetical protein
VTGKPFALALADFHAPGSMIWSREALPGYLYGVFAYAETRPDGRVAVGAPTDKLIDKDEIPAGLFRDPAMSGLSAIIFSNAATMAKFNRMGFLAGLRPPGLAMRRQGFFFDSTPDALEPIPFDLDILSDEYTALWPWGEMWSVELEVFHNPLAACPLAMDMLPFATHWFEQDGEVVCQTIWAKTVLSSMTELRSNTKWGTGAAPNL